MNISDVSRATYANKKHMQRRRGKATAGFPKCGAPYGAVSMRRPSNTKSWGTPTILRTPFFGFLALLN